MPAVILNKKFLDLKTEKKTNAHPNGMDKKANVMRICPFILVLTLPNAWSLQISMISSRVEDNTNEGISENSNCKKEGKILEHSEGKCS